jgi:ferric-dicitrate binding protein FerR (iron transport regulator)
VTTCVDPDPVRAAYIAWCDAEDTQAAAWDAYRQQPICTPEHDAAFETWWAALEATDAARAAYYALEAPSL